MKYYQYPLRSGQTIVSPVDLSYALAANQTIDLNRISPADFRRISILADEIMADIVTELSEGKVWRTPAVALAQPAIEGFSPQNFCLIHKGKVYIRNGYRYVLLDSFLETATYDECLYVTQNLAFQAAICQAALAAKHDPDQSLEQAI